MNSKVTLVKVQELDKRTNKMIDVPELLIPELSDKELMERYHQIKPLVKYENDYYKLKKYSLRELKHNSFIWFNPEDLKSVVDLDNYDLLDEFDCYHSFGYYGLFKPTIAEVLTQYPDELLKESNAFILCDYPKYDSDLEANSDIFKAGYHESTIKALRLKK